MTTVQVYHQWAQQHPNAMTPRILKIEQVGDYFIEFSEGSDFDHNPLYGVSVLYWNGQRFTGLHKFDSFNKSFNNRGEAIQHFAKVKIIVATRGR